MQLECCRQVGRKGFERTSIERNAKRRHGSTAYVTCARTRNGADQWRVSAWRTSAVNRRRTTAAGTRAGHGGNDDEIVRNAARRRWCARIVTTDKKKRKTHVRFEKFLRVYVMRGPKDCSFYLYNWLYYISLRTKL